ncbi:MAG: putative O-glycosylation ligase, exosortase A system-associated, partial [Burkholderiaceae bacterium]|nr:putative O-glycosylation ligase, exosortase A system-associated [Burkholderiaceae bacterium]
AKRPFIALGMWIWTALFFPNAWMYGLGTVIRYNMIFAGIAMVGYLMLKDKPKTNWGAIGVLVTLFFFWTCISSLLGSGNPTSISERWFYLLKILLLFYFIILIITKKLHIDFFLWCVVFSVGFFAALEALKFIGTGGGHQIVGLSGHVLGDRNELAVAFVMLLPICYYLLVEYGRRSNILRLGLLGLCGLTVLSIIGTQSRGGMIALTSLFLYMFVKSDRKLTLLVLVAILVFVASQFISAEWAQRMDTIGAADKDESFMGRVVAWKLSFIVAVQNPVFGGGFKVIEYWPNWVELSSQFDSFPFFTTGTARPDPKGAHAAHSIYFQLLGEHGFGGLAIYLSFIVVAFRKAGKIARVARKHASLDWIATLATMLQLCLFGFCLGAAALSFAYFDLTFAILAIIQVLDSRILPAQLALLERAQSDDAPVPTRMTSAR